MHGPQVFYYESSVEGKKLAEAVQSSLNKKLEIDRPREIKVTQNAKKFARFTLATTKRYRAADGETKQDTQWHSVTFWGKGADVSALFDRLQPQ